MTSLVLYLVIFAFVGLAVLLLAVAVSTERNRQTDRSLDELNERLAEVAEQNLTPDERRARDRSRREREKAQREDIARFDDGT